MPDAGWVPTIAQQLHAERSRRERRHRALLAALVIVIAAVVGVRLLDELPLATASASTSVTTAAPTTTTVVSALNPNLVDAFERAQAAAVNAGFHLTITSGFRSAAKQQELLNAEVAKRGSLAEALWWVFPPAQSMHVKGLAIDVGDGPAADWLENNGDRFGLCRTLDWEWWHFEWRVNWEETRSCPAPAKKPADALS